MSSDKLKVPWYDGNADKAFPYGVVLHPDTLFPMYRYQQWEMMEKEGTISDEDMVMLVNYRERV